MRTRFCFPTIGLCTLTLCAQDGRVMPGTLPSDGESTRNGTASAREIDLPLPTASPRTIQPGQFEPLSAREKAALALRNSVGPQAFASRLLVTGINQWQDYPEEWPGGMEGFGMRFGSRMGRLWVRNAVQLGADVAFKTDPRYDRCNCSGFLPRTGHAWKRVVVALKDDGGETIAISSLAGAYVPPIVTDQWYPSRLNTWGHKMRSGSDFMMWSGATNMLREFWPEISRKLPRKVPFVKSLYR